MRPHKHLERYRQIVGVLLDEGLDNAIDVTGLRRFAPPSARLRRERSNPESFATRLRHTLERLGPAFVKLGQAASTRADIIPDDVIAELRRLQDDVAPFPNDVARSLIESELGAPIGELFTTFDDHPVAAASLGQCYGATLEDDSSVIVKVQRPLAEETVDTDLDILPTQARFVAQPSETGDEYDVVSIAEEFASAVRGELDYLAEAANADRLLSAFADDDTVLFPAVHWEYTTKRILTLERLDGIPLNRLDLLDEAGMDRKELARRGIFCYLEQIFSHGFYHADPHPGNLFAMPDGRIGFTDFGRVGTVSQIGRDQLADLFTAIVDDDPGLAVDTLVSAVDSPGEVDVAALEREVSRLITKYYNKSLDQVRIGELISEVMSMIRSHHLMMNAELALLLTTLVVLEGLGRMLDPEFDFVAVTAPFTRRITNERLSPAHLAKALTHRMRRSVRGFADVPDSIMRILRMLGSGEFRMAVKPTGLDPIMRRFEEIANRLSFALVVSAFVIGLSMLLANTPLPEWFVWVARVALAAALGVGSWFFISAFASRYRRK